MISNKRIFFLQKWVLKRDKKIDSNFLLINENSLSKSRKKLTQRIVVQELFLKNFIRLSVSVSFKRGYVILVKKKKRGTMLEKKKELWRCAWNIINQFE
jgi:hypothetical protein